MENNLIVVKQLPIIEDQLWQVKASVDARVAQVLALDRSYLQGRQEGPCRVEQGVSGLGGSPP